MTESEARERAQRQGIQVRQLPSKAFRFVGDGVDVVVADLRNLTEKDLQRYAPDDDTPCA